MALTGDGDTYSAGNDMKAFLTVTDPETAVQKSNATIKELIRTLYTFPKVLVCVVNGPCIGIAATTAALCDIIYADDTVNVNQIV